MRKSSIGSSQNILLSIDVKVIVIWSPKQSKTALSNQNTVMKEQTSNLTTTSDIRKTSKITTEKTFVCLLLKAHLIPAIDPIRFPLIRTK